MSKFVAVRDCWRWVLVDDDGKLVSESKHSYPSKELVLEDLEQYGKPEHPDVEVEVWDASQLELVEPESK